MLSANVPATSWSPAFPRLDGLAGLARPTARETAVPQSVANAGGGGRSPAETVEIGAAFRQELDANRTLLDSGEPMPAIERAYREKLQDTGEMALLSQDVYFDKSNPALLPQGYTALSDKQAEARFEGFTARDDAAGFYSRVYHDANTDTYVVVNRGTDDASAPVGILFGMPDGKANAALIAGERTAQADIATTNALAMNEATGRRVRFAGHSLGGALASLQGALVEKPTTVFNPLGINEKLFALYNAPRKEFDRYVHAYTVAGEPVARANGFLGLEQAAHTTPLPSRQVNGVGPEGIRTSPGSDDAHSMVAVMAGLLQRYQP